MAKQVLWLDDQIERYSEVLNLFKDAGLEITSAQTVEEAKKYISAKEFDVYVLDIMISDSDGHDGIDVGLQIKQENDERVIVFLSAHLHQDSYVRKVKTIPWNAGVLEKGFGGGSQNVIETVINPISKWAKKPPKKRPSEYFEELRRSNSSPTRISFKSFEALPSVVRDRLTEKVEKKALTAINDAFNNGAIWVLICGSIKNVANSVEDVADIPDEESLLAFAREKGYAYFEFTAPIHQDEITLGNVCQNKQYINYPTLKVSFGNDNLERYEIHFDTGCPITLFNYDNLVDAGHISPTKRNLRGCRRETKERYNYVLAQLELLVECPLGEHGRQATTVQIQAIKSWSKYSFSGKCSEKCQTHETTTAFIYDPKICKFRAQGLLGRDILYSGDGIKITLDGTKN